MMLSFLNHSPELILMIKIILKKLVREIWKPLLHLRKGIADDIARAALEGGAPGPTITFGEGGGVRDKIPLLRMTKGPEKEFVWCVVEKNEADDIFGGMARAGKITEPGRGFMYSIPVRSGLINVSVRSPPRVMEPIWIRSFLLWTI